MLREWIMGEEKGGRGPWADDTCLKGLRSLARWRRGRGPSSDGRRGGGFGVWLAEAVR